MIETKFKFFLGAFSRRSSCMVAVAAVLAFSLAVDLVQAAVTEHAGQCPEANINSGTYIRLLGTAGGPINRHFRSQPASLLTVDGEHYLVDAGDGVSRQLIKAGVPVPGVRQIFLTHLHGDHVVGLAPLLMFDWAAGARRAVGIYGPPGTQKLVRDGLEYISTPVEIFRSQYPPVPELMDLFSGIEPEVRAGSEPTLIYSDNKVNILAVENSHYVTMPEIVRAYGRDRAYSYRFDTRGRSVVFTGDTGPSEALVMLAQNADVLVTEVIDLERQIVVVRKMTNLPDEKIKGVIDHMREEHITPEAIGKLATRASVKSIVLTHIVPSTDDEGDVSPYIAGIRKYYAGPIHFGKDMDCY